MRILFLGTAASISSSRSRLPAIAFQLQNSGEIILFDTGEDIQRAYIEAKLKLNKPMTILITHMHGDHVIGLPGFLFRLNLSNRERDLEIIGPRGLFFYLLSHRLTVGLITNYSIYVREIDLENGEVLVYPPLNKDFSLENLESRISREKIKDSSIIKETNNYTIKVLQADHSAVQNFSYVFEEQDPPGKFNPERAQELGVPRGYLWNKLQKGHPVTLEDGVVVDPVKSGILGKSRKGRILVVSGDTKPTDAMRNYLKEHQISVLIHEATFLDELRDLAEEKKHTTVKEAALLAKEGNVEKLILTHFSARYLDDLDKIEKEARDFFEGTIIATDGFIFEL
ncbi:MAG: ribonuclease Z [Candidatus Hodarchaeota archaeon]